jgi:biopolymer transport protein ExbB
MTWMTNAFSLLCKGGPVMVPLMVCSIVSVTVMLERYARLKRAHGDSDSLMKKVENAVALGKYKDAVKLCRAEETPLGEMLACGLDCSTARLSEKCMEEHALKATPDLFKRLSMLDTIITISPLLGLLGTVTGMIRSFHIISTKTGMSTPTAITGGVAEALIATATGLAIAITTLIGYNYLTEKAKHVVSDMEVRGTRLINILSNGEEEQYEAKAVGA